MLYFLTSLLLSLFLVSCGIKGEPLPLTYPNFKYLVLGKKIFVLGDGLRVYPSRIYQDGVFLVKKNCFFVMKEGFLSKKVCVKFRKSEEVKFYLKNKTIFVKNYKKFYIFKEKNGKILIKDGKIYENFAKLREGCYFISGVVEDNYLSEPKRFCLKEKGEVSYLIRVRGKVLEVFFFGEEIRVNLYINGKKVNKEPITQNYYRFENYKGGKVRVELLN